MEAAAPPTAKGRRTREEFREAFRAVIARDGYLNAKIADVASEAGKSMGLFYNYYGSKEDLLAEIAQDFNDELAETTTRPFRAGLPPEQALREAIRVFWQTFKRRKPEMIGVFQASMTNPDFADRWRQIRAMAIGRIVVGIRDAQASGFAPGLDPELTASALASMLEHFAYVWLAGGGDAIEQPFDEERAVETLFQLWFHAIYWRGGPTP